ncbi:MAG: hypothetical protein JRH07_05270 [Deltaproteobacteria bacterium]|nr:hypothetical protein [Deltaproteobacteria bacterium]
MYFDKAGTENTEATLQIAKEEALKRKINHIVVASTCGDTGLKMAEMLEGTGVSLVVVSHNVGFKEPGKGEFDADKARRIAGLGGRVLTATMVLRNTGTAIREKQGYSQQDLIANVLRMLGQGMKVCVEIVAMAADAGLIPFADVVAVAGTSRGADTAVIIGADSSNRFFDIKIREILAKPREF